MPSEQRFERYGAKRRSRILRRVAGGALALCLGCGSGSEQIPPSSATKSSSPAHVQELSSPAEPSLTRSGSSGEPSSPPPPEAQFEDIDLADLEPEGEDVELAGLDDSTVATEPMRVGGEVTQPIPVHTPVPVCPEATGRMRVSGTVILKVVIDRQGEVENDVVLIKGLPAGANVAAIEAVREWRFEPATLRGEPVAVTINLSVPLRCL